MGIVTINDEHLYDIASAIRSQNGESTTYLTSEMAPAIRRLEAFSEPVGILSVANNGSFDVKAYSAIDISVPISLYVSGSYEISENGTFNVETYKDVVINVDATGEATGTLSVISNGTYNVSNFASAEVSVSFSIGDFVSGTSLISLNGEHDVKAFENVVVSVITSGTKLISDTLHINENGIYDVTEFSEVFVLVSSSATPEDVVVLKSRPRFDENGKGLVYTVIPSETINFSLNGTYSGLLSYKVVTVQAANMWHMGRYSNPKHPARELIEGTIENLNCLGISTLRKLALAKCSKLSTVVLPDVTTIGSQAFLECSELESVHFMNKEGITISQRAFDGCSKLKYAAFGTVTEIDEYAFNDCAGLRTLSIYGSTVASLLHSNAFDGTCTEYELWNMYVPNWDLYVPYDLVGDYISAPNWSYFFDSNHHHINAIDSAEIEFDGEYIPAHEYENQWITEFKGPNVKGIGEYAFDHCVVLYDVKFPKVETIGDYAFQSTAIWVGAELGTPPDTFNTCTSIGSGALKGVNYTNGAWPNMHFLTYLGGDNPLGHYFDKVNLPNITELQDDTFWGCYMLSAAMVPNVTTIGKSCFALCTSLHHVQFEELTSIGEDAFFHCTSLHEINFPKLTAVPERAFFMCTGLERAFVPDLTTISGLGFAHCETLTEGDFTKVQAISYGAFTNCYNLSIMELPALQTIADTAFDSCYKLQALVLLGSTVANMGSYPGAPFESTPFTESKYLKDEDGFSTYGSIYVPSDLYSQYVAAPGWSYVKDRIVGIDPAEYVLELGDTVMFYGSYVPSGMFVNSTFTKFIGPNVEWVGMLAFSDNANLKNVEMPKCKSLHSHAFEGCVSLQGITLPELTEISIAAFGRCFNLVGVHLPNLISAEKHAFYFANHRTGMIIDLPKYSDDSQQLFYFTNDYGYSLATDVMDIYLSGMTSVGDNANALAIQNPYYCTVAVHLPDIEYIGRSTIDRIIDESSFKYFTDVDACLSFYIGDKLSPGNFKDFVDYSTRKYYYDHHTGSEFGRPTAHVKGGISVPDVAIIYVPKGRYNLFAGQASTVSYIVNHLGGTNYSEILLFNGFRLGSY